MTTLKSDSSSENSYWSIMRALVFAVVFTAQKLQKNHAHLRHGVPLPRVRAQQLRSGPVVGDGGLQDVRAGLPGCSVSGEDQQDQRGRRHIVGSAHQLECNHTGVRRVFGCEIADAKADKLNLRVCSVSTHTHTVVVFYHARVWFSPSESSAVCGRSFAIFRRIDFNLFFGE